jgi:hypothetical protein
VELMQRYSKLADMSKICRSDTVRAVPVEHTSHRVHNVRRRLGAETITQVVADYQAGDSTPTLMLKYSLAKGTVLRLLQDNDINMRHQRMSELEIAEAIKLYQQGWSLARVGKHFNRNPSTIQAVLMRAGVTRRKRWERGAS